MMTRQWKCYRDCDAPGFRKGRLECWGNVAGEFRLIYRRRFFILWPGLWNSRIVAMKKALIPKINILVHNSDTL